MRALSDATTPDRIYEGKLTDLLKAMEDASLRSLGDGGPQELLMMLGKVSTVIRRYEHGHEVPVYR